MKNVLLTGTAASLCLSCFSAAAFAQDGDDDARSESGLTDVIVVEGYRAETTQSAARINVPIDEVPINVQVFTKDAIEDLQLLTQRDALQFSAAVEDKRVRGFNTGEFFRNGFVHLSDSPGFTIERIEIVRGPTATLNGPVTPGGGINTITKKARIGDSFGQLGAYYGFSEDSRDNRGFNVDLNVGDIGLEAEHGAVGAFRFVGGYQQDTGFQTRTDNELNAILPSFQFRPFENTVVDLEYYRYQINTDRTDRPFGIELTIPGPTPGEEIPLALAYDIDPRASYFGASTDIEESLEDWSASITQSFADDRIIASLSYNDHNRDFVFGPGNRPRIDIFYRVLPRAGADPDTTDPADFELRRLTENLSLKNDIDQLSGLVTFVADDAGDHRFISGFDFFDQDQRLIIMRPRESGQTSGFFFEFFEIEDVNTRSLNFNAGAADVFFTTVLARDREIKQKSGFLNYQGAFFDDRLHVLAGVTYSDIEIDQSDPRVSPVMTEVIADSEEWLIQGGAVFDIIEGIGLYGNYSQSQLPDLNDPDFSQAPPVRKGDQIEFGVKYSLFDDLIVGTFGYYFIDEEVRGPDNDRDVEAQGFDFDAFIQPVDNWMTVFSFSHVDTEVTASGSSTFVVGQPLVDEIPNKLAIWSKYDFEAGALDGLSLGGGFTWTGRAVRPTAAAAQSVKTLNGEVLRYNPVTRLDLFAEYVCETPWGNEMELSLNVRNLTKEDNISTVVPLVPLQGGVQPNGDPYEFDGSVEFMLGLALRY